MNFFFLGYGMTETSPVSFLTDINDPIKYRCETVGKVMSHVEARVVNPDTGTILPTNSVGELHTRGFLVMNGYWDGTLKLQDLNEFFQIEEILLFFSTKTNCKCN
jgi:fatty-acyl-CoA synthase